MTTLKIWDGSAWVDMGGSVAGNAPVYGPSGEVILAGTPVGAGTGPGVGQYTRRAGPQQDVHLRTGAAANSLAFVESQAGVFLAANCTFDGTNWVRTTAGSVATLVLVSPTGYLQLLIKDIGPATWTTFDRTQTLDPNQLAFPDGGGVVGRLTRTLGPPEDIHLRSGDAAGSYAFVEAVSNAILAGNGYWDGTNWQRFDTSLKSVVAQAVPDGTFRVYDAPAGANPATITERLNISTQGTIEQITTPSGGPLLTGSSVAHIATNLYFDGTNWNRYNTGLQGTLLRLAPGGQLDVYFTGVGANPVTFTQVYNLTDAGNRPAIANTALATYAAYGAGWSAYGGGAAPYSARVSRDALGYVHLGGLLQGAAAGAGSTNMVALVAGLRPQYEHIVPCMTQFGTYEVRVTTGGGVNIITGAGGFPSGWFALDSIPPYYAYS